MQLLNHCDHSTSAKLHCLLRKRLLSNGVGSEVQPPGDSLFHSCTLSSQAFSEYQIQQMTANFVDQFGFNDEEFADQDDNIK